MFCLCCTVPEYKAEKQEAGVCTGFLFCGSANQAKHLCFLSMLQDLMQIIQTFSDDQFPKDGVASLRCHDLSRCACPERGRSRRDIQWKLDHADAVRIKHLKLIPLRDGVKAVGVAFCLEGCRSLRVSVVSLRVIAE